MKIILDGSKMQTKDALHQVVAATFNFPEYYQENLEHFYDLMCEIYVDIEIELINKDIFLESMKDYAEDFIACLIDIAQEYNNIQFLS